MVWWFPGISPRAEFYAPFGAARFRALDQRMEKPTFPGVGLIKRNCRSGKELWGSSDLEG
jgi:hypothetical protein